MRTNHKWNHEQLLALYKLRDTCTMQEIGDLHGISRQRVEQLLRGASFPKKPRRHSTVMRARATEAQAKRQIHRAEMALKRSGLLQRLALACEEYKQGVGYNRLMRKYHIGQDTILSYMYDKGIARRLSRGGKNTRYPEIEKRNRGITEDYVAGVPIEEIMKKYSVKRGVVNTATLMAEVRRTPKQAGALRKNPHV